MSHFNWVFVFYIQWGNEQLEIKGYCIVIFYISGHFVSLFGLFIGPISQVKLHYLKWYYGAVRAELTPPHHRSFWPWQSHTTKMKMMLISEPPKSAISSPAVRNVSVNKIEVWNMTFSVCLKKTHRNSYSMSWRNDFWTLQSLVIIEETLYRCTVCDKLLFTKRS